MSPKFDYDNIVRVLPSANLHVGQRAWIVGVFESRPKGSYFERFPAGTVYSIEFEDGTSSQLHESDLELDQS